MKMQVFRFLLALSALTFLSQCEPLPIDADITDASSRICINAFVSPENNWSVQVTRGKYILAPDYVYANQGYRYLPITTANVTITETASSAQLEYRPIEDYNYGGWYQNDLEKPQTGKTYTINVNAPGFKEVSATAFIPEAIAIIKTEPITTIPDSNGMISMYVYFQDPVGIANYYQLCVSSTVTIGTDITYWESELTTKDSKFGIQYNSDEILVGGESDIPKLALFSDAGMDGTVIKIPVIVPIQSQSSHHVVLKHLSSEYYRYYTDILLQSSTYGSAFAQPVQVYSNVQNGFGIFAGYNQSKYLY